MNDEEFSQIFRKLDEAENIMDRNMLSRLHKHEEVMNCRPKCVKTIRFFAKGVQSQNKFVLQIHAKILDEFGRCISGTLSENIDTLLVSFQGPSQTNTNAPNSQSFTINGNCYDFSVENHDFCDTENFKLEVFNLDGNESNIYEWHNNRDQNLDGFEVIHDSNFSSCDISMIFDNSRDLVKVSKKFQKMIGLHTTTRTCAIINIWKYLNKNKLICNDLILFDEKLTKCLPMDQNNEMNYAGKKVHFHDFFELIENCVFLPIDPLQLRFPCTNFHFVFDISIERDEYSEPIKLYSDKKTSIYESKLQSYINEMLEVEKRIFHLNEFSNDPIKKLNDFSTKYGMDIDDQKIASLINDMLVSKNIQV